MHKLMYKIQSLYLRIAFNLRYLINIQQNEIKLHI
jgi:hypothetical protein